METEETERTLAVEDAIEFRRCAYEKVIDLSDVDIENCSVQIADIERSLKHVAFDYGEKHNKNRPDGWHAIDKEDLPAQTIRVARLSPAIIPTVVAHADGTITVNQNFVRLLHKLTELGLRGPNGNIFDAHRDGETRPRKLGNFYFLLLEALAWELVRGRYRINRWGFAELGVQQSVACFDPGTRMANLTALLFFWLCILEDSRGPCEARLRFLLSKRCPELVWGWPEEETESLIANVLCFSLDLLCPGRGVDVHRLARVSTGISHAEFQAQWQNTIRDR